MKKLKIISYLIILILIAFIAIFFYTKIKRQNKNIAEPQFTKQGQLVFIKKNSNDIIKMIDIEIADTDAKKQQGLMWRQSIPQDSGMLFPYNNEKMLSFWMKNTYISLDTLFADKSMKIVTIHQNTIPLDETSISSKVPAQYVIETISGFCEKYNIDIGNKIKFDIIN